MLMSYQNPNYVVQSAFDWVFKAPPAERSASYFSETDSGFILNLDLPGVGPDGLDIELKGRHLNLKTTRLRGESDETRGYRWILPKDADAENIRAHLTHGVLTLEIDKKPTATPRKITLSSRTAANPA